MSGLLTPLFVTPSLVIEITVGEHFGVMDEGGDIELRPGTSEYLGVPASF